MPMTAFVMFVNDYGTTLRANYVAGDATVKMAAGSGAALLAALADNFNPAPSLARPVRVTLRPIPFTNRAQSLVIQSTGLIGDDLQDCVAVEGTDRDYNAGSVCEFDITAGMLEKLAGAINAIEGDATIVRSTMQLDNPDLIHTLDAAKLTGVLDPARVAGVLEPHTTTLTQIGGLTPIFKGSLITTDGVAWLGLPPAADGRFIVYDSAQVSGLARRLLLAGDVPDLSGTYQPRDPQLDDVAGIAPTKGRVLVGDGTHWQPLPVGTDTYVITSDAAQPLGIKWAAPAGGGGGGTPGGSAGEVQFNDAGTFAGAAGFVVSTAGPRVKVTAVDNTAPILVLKGIAGMSGNLAHLYEPPGSTTPWVYIDASGILHANAPTGGVTFQASGSIAADGAIRSAVGFKADYDSYTGIWFTVPYYCGTIRSAGADGPTAIAGRTTTTAAWVDAGARAFSAQINDVAKLDVFANGDVDACPEGPTATNADDHFFFMPGCAGPPTGTPTARGGVACKIDTTNKKFCARIGGAWYSTPLT